MQLVVTVLSTNGSAIPLNHHLDAQPTDCDDTGSRIREPWNGTPVGCSQIHSSLAKKMEESMNCFEQPWINAKTACKFSHTKEYNPYWHFYPAICSKDSASLQLLFTTVTLTVTLYNSTFSVPFYNCNCLQQYLYRNFLQLQLYNCMTILLYSNFLLCIL